MAVNVLVPLDKNGNHKSWEGYGVELKENWVFMDTLDYVGFDRGRSALNIIWKSRKTGKTYMSSMSLLDEALKDQQIQEGYSIRGEFTFKKQGTAVLLKANYLTSI